jgi:hypothetical protein
MPESPDVPRYPVNDRRQWIAQIAGSELWRGVLLIVTLVVAVLVAGYLFVGYL